MTGGMIDTEKEPGPALQALADELLERAIPTELRDTMGGNIGALAGALAKAQGAMRAAALDGENPGYKRGNENAKYATLASCWEAARAPLAENGLAVVQLPTTRDGIVTVRSMLVHSAGGWMTCTASVRPQDGSAHKLGSAISYLRRYTFSALVGVAQEDDDGNSAQGLDGDGKPERQQAGRQQERGGRQERRPAAQRQERKAPPAKAEPARERPEMPEEWKRMAATPETIGKLERRLVHPQLPRDRFEKVMKVLDDMKVKGETVGNTMTVKDAGRLTEWAAQVLVFDMGEDIRAASAATTEGGDNA